MQTLLDEDRLRGILNAVQAGIVVVDAEGHRVAYANPAALRTIGASNDEVIGKVCYSFLCPAHVERCPITDLGQRVDNSECVVIDSRGERVPVLKTVVPTIFGDRMYLVESFLDIRERKDMEEKLKLCSEHLEDLVEARTSGLAESERKYRLLVDNIADVVFTIDLKGNYTFCTPQAEKMTGYTTQQLLSMNMKELIAPEDLPRVLKSLETRRRIQTELSPIRFDVIRANGTRLPIEVKTSLQLEGNEPVGVQGVARDISERKRIEDALRNSEARFRELANLLPQIVFETDLTGNYTFANRSGLAAGGYTEEETLNGLNAFQTFAEQDRARAMETIGRILTGEDVGPNEYTALRKDGSTFPVLVHSTAIVREGKFVGVRGVAVDITERKRMEEELLTSKRLAAIGEAAAMVGHDLRNPLQATTTALYLAKKLLSSGGAEERNQALRLLEELDDQVYYMDKIVSDLQDYARPIDAELLETDVAELINDVISSVKIPVTVNVSSLVEAEHPPKASVHPALLRRALVNLILNAIQAMPNGGELTISASKIQDSAVITVQDTGTGIPAENLDKIFNPFFTTKAQGQGLGLAVCKRLVEAQRGEITVKSQLGKGSIFTIKLPTNTSTGVS